MVELDSAGRSQLRAIGTGEFNFEKAVSGRSLISSASEEKSLKSGERRDWPYSFTEYLRGHIGSMVRIEYVFPGGQRTASMGRLKIVGTDFVGLAAPRTGEQVLIGFSSIASIKLLSGK